MDGETIGYRMIRPTIANEEDRAKRERLEEARNRLTEEHINPIHIDGIATLNEAVPRLGGADVRRPVPALRLPARRARRPVPRRPRVDRGALREGGRQAVPPGPESG